MSHYDYVALAYGVFAVAMAWDYPAPRLRLKRAHRDILLRARREQAREHPRKDA